MTQELFRVYDSDSIKPIEDALIMIAPLDTINRVFQLHKEATARIERETPCILHINKSANWPVIAIVPNTREWQP